MDGAQKLSKTRNQLLQLEQSIGRDEELRKNGAILRECAHLNQLQTALKTAGNQGRLLLSLHASLIGSSTQDSATGFIGKDLETVQNAFVELMAAGLDRYQTGLKELLTTMMKLLGVGILYITSQVLGGWNEKFQGYNPLFVKSSGSLYRELGVLFLIASGLVDSVFNLLASTTDLPKTSRKVFADIGSIYLLLMILYSNDSENNPKGAELWESMQPFLKRSLPSIEQSLVDRIDRQVIDTAIANPILSYLQVVKTALENNDLPALMRSIEELHSSMGISKDGLQKDLQQIKDLSHAIALNLGFASDEAGKATTHITQSR